MIFQSNESSHHNLFLDIPRYFFSNEQNNRQNSKSYSNKIEKIEKLSKQKNEKKFKGFFVALIAEPTSLCLPALTEMTYANRVWGKTDNGANLKMDTIKDGSFGPASATVVAATAATAWKCLLTKSAGFDVFAHFESFWIALVVFLHFGPFLDRFGSFSDWNFGTSLGSIY